MMEEMPIRPGVQIEPISYDDFHSIDYDVMGIAFSIHRDILEVPLFYDAIVHFLGGEEMVVKQIEVTDGSRLLGRQKAHLIASDIAFKISSVTKYERQYENHFCRFIRYTSLKAIHWINFNHDKVVFKTILK